MPYFPEGSALTMKQGATDSCTKLALYSNTQRKRIFVRMLVCFSDNNKNGLLCGKVDFLHCVCCDSCHHRPFPSQRQQKAGQSSPNLHPRDFSRLLAFKYLFHHYKTVFPKKKATALFCFDFWNDFADMK